MDVHVKVRGVAPLYKNSIDVIFPGKTIKDLVDAMVPKYGNGIRKAIIDKNGEIDMELLVFESG